MADFTQIAPNMARVQVWCSVLVLCVVPSDCLYQKDKRWKQDGRDPFQNQIKYWHCHQCRGQIWPLWVFRSDLILSLKPNSHSLWTVAWFCFCFKSQNWWLCQYFMCSLRNSWSNSIQDPNSFDHGFCHLNSFGGFPAYPVWGKLLQCFEKLHNMTYIFSLNL